MPTRKSVKQRPVGRPASDSANALNAIIDAACRQFAEHGIKGTTNPMIAHIAGVSPAMVHYYFKRREDLYQAVLAHLLEPIIGRLHSATTLEQWVNTFHGYFLTKPWAPQLMAREVFMHNGQLRPWFLQDYGPVVFGLARTLISRELAAAGNSELNVERHIILLQGLLVFPFLGLEVGQSLSGKTFDAEMMEGFRKDALRLFRQGIQHTP
jgi:AcrR family transcriptional regulator